MDGDAKDEEMEFNLCVERLLDGEKGKVEWVELGAGGYGRTLEMTLLFFEDTVVISNVNWRGFCFLFFYLMKLDEAKKVCVY